MTTFGGSGEGKYFGMFVSKTDYATLKFPNVYSELSQILGLK